MLVWHIFTFPALLNNYEFVEDIGTIFLVKFLINQITKLMIKKIGKDY